MALMLNLCMVVVGLLCYFTLGLDLMPKIDFPVVTVTVVLPGGSPEVMEQQVTRLVEDAVAQLGGLDYIKSTSSTSLSSVVVVFNLNKNGDVATQEVRDKVAGITNNLPRDIDTPIVQKVDLAAQPVISVVLSGQMDIGRLTLFADDTIKDALSSVDGVGRVNLVGGQARQINVFLDHTRLAGYGVAVQEVQDAISRQNLEVAGGTLRDSLSQTPMRTRTLLDSVADLDDVVVKVVNGVPIPLRAVGRAEDGLQDATSVSRLDEDRALTLQVVKSSDANTVKVIEGVKARVRDLSRELPPGVKLTLTQDQSIFIEESVHEILEHLVLGSLLAGGMVWLFLGSLRATLISVVAIPCSLLGGFVAMAAFSMTLNQITMLALALVVGIVIDDAVVVLEEIVRLMEEEHLSPQDAAEKGIQAIGFSVLAITLSLVVIFVPIAFLPGLVGRYFAGYGITMATTITISMLVSFTLTPVLCAKFLKPSKPRQGEGLYDRLLGQPYAWVVHQCLRFRFLVILACVGVAGWGVWLYGHVGQDFVAPQDGGSLRVKITAPPGNSVEAMDRMVSEIARRIRREVPQVQSTLMTVGGDANSGTPVNRAEIFIQMNPWDERARHKPTCTVFDAQRATRRLLADYPDLRTSTLFEETDFQCVLRGPDLEVLSSAADRLRKELRQRPGFVDVDLDQDASAPEANVYIDRAVAFRMNVQPLDVASTLSTLIGGTKVSSFFVGKDRLDVVVRLQPEQRTRAEVIPQLMVPDSSGRLVPLADLVRVDWQQAPALVNRYDRQRQVTVLSNLDGLALGQAMATGKKLVEDMGLPATYTVEWQGNGQYMAPTLMAFAISFLVSVVFMYMVLASQFESYVDPAIILTTLPLALPFALYSLLVAGATLNIFSALGLFLLVGVVKKNAIFQIDTTRELMAHGKPLYHALVESNRTRLRPILMTTVALVVAMLPVALAGANGWTRSPMAIVIVGGQSLSMLLTLVVVPVLYSYVHDPLGRKWREEPGFGLRPPHEEPEAAPETPAKGSPGERPVPPEEE